MAVRCGIDLGTTYSAISWFDEYNNRVETIDLESADGAKTLRSVVYYPAEGQPPVVGDTASNAARQQPERVVAAIKRSMGTSFKAGPIDGVEYTPQQVSAEILKTIARDAQTFLGEEVQEVVITVPAYFGDNERAATLEAGELAGLKVLELLPEPHAAALAFAVDKVADIVDKHLLVYDLGGGTFDVTLIHATTTTDPNSGGIKLDIKTLCKEGNASLGGLDWDRILAQIVAERIRQEHGIDVWADARNEAALLDNCEKAKRHLTRSSPVSIIGDLANHQVEVSASDFEDNTRDLLLATEMLLRKVIEDAEKQHGISPDQIDVMLTGGSSRMPMVKKMIEGVTGRPPLQHRNPELLVTIGAAYWAQLLQADSSIPVTSKAADGTIQTVPISVNPGGLVDTSVYAIGVEVLRPDGKGDFASFNSVIVPAGAPYGEEFKKEFRTSHENMTEILVALYKGDSPALEECESLMTFTISGLPPNLRPGTRVNVTLSYDQSGILRGAAAIETGQQVEIIVDRSKL